MGNNSVDSWEIGSRTLSMPVEIRDAKLAGAVFSCAAAAADRTLHGTPFKPFKTGGRALSILVCIQYLDGDLD